MKKGVVYELDYYYDNPVEVMGVSDDIIKISSMNNQKHCLLQKVKMITEKTLDELQRQGLAKMVNGFDGYDFDAAIYSHKDDFYLYENWKEGGFAMTEQEMAEDPEGPYCGFWERKTIVTHYRVCKK